MKISQYATSTLLNWKKNQLLSALMVINKTGDLRQEFDGLSYSEITKKEIIKKIKAGKNV